MKAKEIRVGGTYLAKVNEKVVPVRVDEIRQGGFTKGGSQVAYDVTNLKTGRKTTFRSAAKFRSEVKPESLGVGGLVGVKVGEVDLEAKQRPDPTRRPRLTSSVQSAVVTADLTTATGSPSTQPTPSDQPTERVPRSSIAAKLAEAQAARTTAGQDTAPHLIVRARAGTGKTTTMIEGLKVLRGVEPRIEPSPQQRAVWDSLLLSRDHARTVGFVAFNKSIATELQGRVPAGVDAMTMHSMGNRAVAAAFGRVRLNEYRVRDIIAELTGRDGRELQRNSPVLVKAVEELVGLCKMNLVSSDQPGSSGFGDWDTALKELADHYDVDLNGNRGEVFSLVPRVLDRCRDVRRDGCMDYDDMIWLPVVLNLPVRRYDLLLVDEAQDLNRCQQTLARRAGNRLVLVGDDRQAIYGFAGADSESLRRMEDELSGPPCVACGAAPWGTKEGPSFANGVYSCACGAPLPGRGCVVLPLTVTRRCGKAIVAEARRYVPDFEAHESNPEGTVGQAKFPGKRNDGTEVRWEDGYGAAVADGDFVLCRTNAPLVNQCFKFIRLGIKANIQGRDVGAGLKSTVKKLCPGKLIREDVNRGRGVPTPDPDSGEGTPIPEFVRRLDDWLAAETAKETAKRNPSENKLAGLQDRYECLTAFADGCDRTSDLLARIDAVFTDDKTVRGVRLSSIHRAKGLEARRVFWLRGDGNRTFGPPADRLQLWELGQEENLAYVATTRAIEELVYVS